MPVIGPFFSNLIFFAMASIFSHGFAAAAIGTCFAEKKHLSRFLILGALCAILPDADVIAFKFGIPYDHVLGHRGLTHSLAFAAVWGMLLAWLTKSSEGSNPNLWIVWAIYFAICTASHGMLDAITNGGRGVAFFAPFDNHRYFFPWRPVQVSPIGASRFFSEWGLRVIMSELRYIGVPFAILMAFGLGFRWWKRRT